MSTRCLTRVFSGKTPVACLYRHYDGYPDGHGSDLVEVCRGLRIVNGYSSASTIPRSRMVNGASRMAALIVIKLEEEDLAIYAPDAQDCWEDYEYHVICPDIEQANAAGPDGVEPVIKAFHVSGEGEKRKLEPVEIP